MTARGDGWAPVAPHELPGRLAALLAERPGLVRVAVDGPAAAGPDQLAAALPDPLRALGRPAVCVPATAFWRDASVRLEHGREDVESLPDWLDSGALRREVLDAVVERGAYLPSLRDPGSNRSTRAAPVALPDNAVVIVSGAFLLGRGLPFDVVVHLAMSPAARARRTPADEAWTLPAYDAYDRGARPAEAADVVITCDHPDRPAVRGLH